MKSFFSFLLCLVALATALPSADHFGREESNHKPKGSDTHEVQANKTHHGKEAHQASSSLSVFGLGGILAAATPTLPVPEPSSEPASDDESDVWPDPSTASDDDSTTDDTTYEESSTTDTTSSDDASTPDLNPDDVSEAGTDSDDLGTTVDSNPDDVSEVGTDSDDPGTTVDSNLDDASEVGTSSDVDTNSYHSVDSSSDSSNEGDVYEGEWPPPTDTEPGNSIYSLPGNPDVGGITSLNGGLGTIPEEDENETSDGGHSDGSSDAGSTSGGGSGGSVVSGSGGGSTSDRGSGGSVGSGSGGGSTSGAGSGGSVASGSGGGSTSGGGSLFSGSDVLGNVLGSGSDGHDSHGGHDGSSGGKKTKHHSTARPTKTHHSKTHHSKTQKSTSSPHPTTLHTTIKSAGSSLTTTCFKATVHDHSTKICATVPVDAKATSIADNDDKPVLLYVAEVCTQRWRRAHPKDDWNKHPQCWTSNVYSQIYRTPPTCPWKTTGKDKGSEKQLRDCEWRCGRSICKKQQGLD